MGLLNAIWSRDISIVRSLLDQGFSPNGDPKENHPLNLAIELNSIEIISLLIDYGVDLGLLPIHPLENQIALHCAVMHCNKEIVTKILERTDNWQAIDSNGATVLHLVLESKEDNKIEIMKVFLDLGMDVDVKNILEETPLLIACKYRLWCVADFLIKRGANINSQDCNGDSILHCLMMCEDKQMCLNEYAGRYVDSKAEFMKQLLCKGVVADCRNKAGQTPLQLAINNNLLSAILILLKYVKDSSCFASQENRTIVLSMLELNINRFCCNEKHYDPEKLSQIDAVVKILLDRQFPIDGLDGSGNTVLHVAAREKKFFVLPIFLEHLKDVNARNDCGETALHVILNTSAVNEKGLEDAVVAMLSKGGSFNLLDKDGLSPVHLAAKKKHVTILELFKAKGADLKISTPTGENLWHLFASSRYAGKDKDMITFLAKEGLDVNATNQAGSTPLHIVLECYPNVSLIQALIAIGADVNLKQESSQMMPIHLAAKYSDVDALRLLLKTGADPNAKASQTSVLHIAARWPASYDIIKDLIRSGADLDAIDEVGRLPVHYIIEQKDMRILWYLLALGEEIPDYCNLRFGWLNKLLLLRRYREYSIKFQCLGMSVIDLSRFFEGEDDPKLKESGARDDKLYLHSALSEMEKMKALQISHNKSLYDFMRMSLRQRVIHAEQGELAKIVALPDLECRFILYYDMIIRKYHEALIRKPLLEPAKIAFARLVNFSLPDLCVDVIFDYLKNHSLRLMIRASDMSLAEKD